MCRWFAYISPTEECLLEDVLVAPAHALSKQVHDHYLPKLLSHAPGAATTEAEITTRNRLFNVDGFGMSFYTNSFSRFSGEHPSEKPVLHPTLYKTIQPPLHDRNFRSLCANTSSLCVLAHVRAATASAVVETNCHPFVFGRHTIMHNGFIADFQKISRQMCNLMSADCYENVSGSTDTEHIAALYMTYLTFSDGKAGWEQEYTEQQMLTALEQTIGTIIDLQEKALADKAQPNDLNVAVTDGNKLVAIRFRNHATEQPPSLYFSTTAGVTLNRRFPDHPDGKDAPHGAAKDTADKKGKDELQKGSKGETAEGENPHKQLPASHHGKHVIIASEPTTYKESEWTLIEKNHAVMAGIDGIKTKPISV